MDFLTQLGDAFGNALRIFFGFIPALIGALLLLLVGWIVARVVRAILVRVLGAVHFDQAMDRAGVSGMIQRGGVRTDAAGLLAGLAYWFVFLIFVVAAANALGVAAITNLVTSIVLWLPQLFVALIVLIVAALIARFVGDLVRGAMDGAGVSGSNIMSTIARYAILAFGAIIALDQIGVGAAIVQTLFAGVMLALALGLALAFGLGGRETARVIVESWYASISNRRPVQQINTSPSDVTRAAPRPRRQTG